MDQPNQQPTEHDDPYVRLIRLINEFEQLAPLLPTAVPENDRPEMSWIIGSTQFILRKATDVIEREF